MNQLCLELKEKYPKALITVLWKTVICILADEVISNDELLHFLAEYFKLLPYKVVLGFNMYSSKTYVFISIPKPSTVSEEEFLTPYASKLVTKDRKPKKWSK